MAGPLALVPPFFLKNTPGQAKNQALADKGTTEMFLSGGALPSDDSGAFTDGEWDIWAFYGTKS